MWIHKDLPKDYLIVQSELVSQLLYARGVHNARAADLFLNPSLDDLHDPFDLYRMEDLMRVIYYFKHYGLHFTIYGDYDVDGVTAATLLKQVFDSYGIKNDVYIPNRKQGYGLTWSAVEDIRRYSDGLITVDCGVTSVDVVKQALDVEFPIIITDHHEPPEGDLPDTIIINPKLGDYPFRSLAGVGVAYKIYQAMERTFGPVLLPIEVLDLVALGTVADVAPLVGENRILVYHGMNALQTSHRVGIEYLIKASGLRQKDVTSTDIAFSLGPRLNAAGRMDTAMRSYDLLLAETASTADAIAREIERFNKKRKQVTQEKVTLAKELAAKYVDDKVIVIEGDFPGSVVGLVAGKLAEYLRQPVVLLHPVDIDRYAGSARSGPTDFSVVKAFNSCSDLLIKFGGHVAAGGVTLSRDNVEKFRQAMQKSAEEQGLIKTQRQVIIDLEISLEEVTIDFFKAVQRLAPFGEGNPQPIFSTPNVRIDELNWSKDGQHLFMKFGKFKGVMFFAENVLTEYILKRLAPKQIIDIAYYLSMNHYNGSSSLQLQLIDVRIP